MNRSTFNYSQEENKYITWLSIGIVTLIILFFVSLISGRYDVPLENIFRILFSSDSKFETERSVIILLRLPRSISTILVGASLSIAGLVYQELFQNRLVSPDLLGVSSGAGFGAALGIVLGMPMIFVGVSSFIFALLTVALTLTIAKIFSKTTSLILLLSGIVVGGFMSSALSMVKFFADQETTLAQITFWLMGSFELARMSDFKVLLPIVGIGVTILILFRYRINIISLGKDEAKTTGIPYEVYEKGLIIIVTFITAISVSFYGTISWIGLVIPHVVRLAVGRQTQYTIPLTLIFGAIFLLGSDILSRSFTASEIPISAITGLIGTPIFFSILFIKKQMVARDD